MTVPRYGKHTAKPSQVLRETVPGAARNRPRCRTFFSDKRKMAFFVSNELITVKFDPAPINGIVFSLDDMPVTCPAIPKCFKAGQPPDMQLMVKLRMFAKGMTEPPDRARTCL